MEPESEPLPAMPPSEGGDDWEGAGAQKEKAAELKSNGDLSGAVEAYTAALLCQPSALTFAARADCLLKLKRPKAAVADCNAALAVNPDSAKALKIKGKAHRHLGEWAESFAALAKANAVDFDPDIQDTFKFVQAKAKVRKLLRNLLDTA
jgi:suppressor of tumorigenicity protein 13